MSDVQSIPLSAFVATLLLNKRVVTALEIVSLINEVSRNYDIYVEDDDFEILSCCVEVSNNGNVFKIKDDLNYSSILDKVLLRGQIITDELGENFNDKIISVRSLLRLCSFKLSDYYMGKIKEEDSICVRRKLVSRVGRGVY